MGDTILVRVTIHEQSLQVSIRQGAQMMMLILFLSSYHLINFFREVAMIQKSKTDAPTPPSQACGSGFSQFVAAFWLALRFFSVRT